jgi:hypothetical protein
MSEELTQEEATAFFAELYMGEHHIPAEIKKWGPAWCINDHGDLSTYDFNMLTRLVFLAHDKCYRASVMNSGPRMVKIAIWKRKQREGNICERHPTIEEALEKWRKRHP